MRNFIGKVSIPGNLIAYASTAGKAPAILVSPPLSSGALLLTDGTQKKMSTEYNTSRSDGQAA